MSSIRILIGTCSQCGAKGFFIGGDKLEWTDSSTTESCAHSLTTLAATGEPSPCPPVEKPVHFPSENEAVYHACLRDLTHKCCHYIERYDNDLDALEQDFDQSKQGIENQYNHLLDKLQVRHTTLLQELAHHKDQRQKQLEDLKSALENYNESCQKALDKIKQTIQDENDGPEREKKCQEIAGSTVKELPAIFDVPYHLKFDDKGVSNAQRQLNTYGNIVFTSLESKKKIDQFVFRNSDQEWLKPWITVALSSAPATQLLQSPSQKYIRRSVSEQPQPPIQPQVQIQSMSQSQIQSKSQSQIQSMSQSQIQSKSQSQLQKSLQTQQNGFGAADAPLSPHSFSTVVPGSGVDVEDSKEEFQFAVKKLEGDCKGTVKIVYELNPPTLEVLRNYKLIVLWVDCANPDIANEDQADISKSRSLNDRMFEISVPFRHEIPAYGVRAEGKLYDQTNERHYPLDKSLMQLGDVTFAKTVPQQSSLLSPRQQLEQSKKPDPNCLQILVDLEKEKKYVQLSKTNLNIQSLHEAVAQAFNLDDPENIKFQSKTKTGNHTVEKRFNKDSMLSSFETNTQYIQASHAKSDDKPGKLKLFLVTSDNRRTKCIIKDLAINYSDLKNAVKAKVKNCPENFVMEIVGGKHQGKQIQKDEDMALILSGEQEFELKIL